MPLSIPQSDSTRAGAAVAEQAEQWCEEHWPENTSVSDHDAVVACLATALTRFLREKCHASEEEIRDALARELDVVYVPAAEVAAKDVAAKAEAPAAAKETAARPGKPPEERLLCDDAFAWFRSGKCQLSSAACWTLIALIQHYNPTEKRSRPGVRLLASTTHLNKSTVVRAVAELEAARAIKVHRKLKAPNWYQFTFPRCF